VTGLGQTLGKMIVIVAPSGAGKSTLLKALFEEVKGLHWSVSTTTRPIRTGEVHGKDYFFVSEDEFKKSMNANEFAEWALVHGKYYGTSKKFIDEGLEKGLNLVFDIDVQGADAIKDAYPEAKAIFIQPPGIDSLKNRLENRATDSEEVIKKRLKNAEQELKRADDYDYKVINDQFDRAKTEFIQLVKGILK
jgi:guanylate kinase